MTKCSKDTVLKRLKSHLSGNSRLLRATPLDFTGLTLEMKADYESTRDMGNFRAMGKMQDFTFNQLCYKNCFGKIDIRFRGSPKHRKGSGLMVKWIKIDKVGDT